jgi:hypothetical protein
MVAFLLLVPTQNGNVFYTSLFPHIYGGKLEEKTGSGHRKPTETLLFARHLILDYFAYCLS